MRKKKKTHTSYLSPPGIKDAGMVAAAEGCEDANGQQSPKLSCCCVVCVISESQPPMCTCHWWGSLWISLMAFRVLIAGFCMEWVMNNSMSPLRLMRVHTVSQRRREKTSVAGTSWNPFSFIHLYVFVCVMDYLLPPYFGRKALNYPVMLAFFFFFFFWSKFLALCMCLCAEHTNKIKPGNMRRATGKGDDITLQYS